MTKSASHRPNPKARSNRGSTLLGLFLGLVLGLLVALGVAWYLRQAPLPFEDKHTQAPVGMTTPPAGGQGKPIALPGKPGGEAAKPRFDFYGILEGKQSAGAPGEAPAAAAQGNSGSNPTNNAAAPATQQSAPAVPTNPQAKDSLFLQVGAYQKPADADNARAKLTLLGFEAEIVEADIPEKGHMYRVRTGPYSSTEEMNKARGALAQNGIQAALVKGGK